MRRLVICDPWKVVIVPFPFTEQAGTKRRPALVLSAQEFNENGHTLLAMITTKTHAPWPGDVTIENLSLAGLRIPCIVRLKVFTLDNRLIIRPIGRLAEKEYRKVQKSIKRYLFSQK